MLLYALMKLSFKSICARLLNWHILLFFLYYLSCHIETLLPSLKLIFVKINGRLKRNSKVRETCSKVGHISTQHPKNSYLWNQIWPPTSTKDKLPACFFFFVLHNQFNWTHTFRSILQTDSLFLLFSNMKKRKKKWKFG